MIIVTVMLDPAEILAKEGLARLLSEIAHAVAEIISRTQRHRFRDYRHQRIIVVLTPISVITRFWARAGSG